MTGWIFTKWTRERKKFQAGVMVHEKAWVNGKAYVQGEFCVILYGWKQSSTWQSGRLGQKSRGSWHESLINHDKESGLYCLEGNKRGVGRKIKWLDLHFREMLWHQCGGWVRQKRTETLLVICRFTSSLISTTLESCRNWSPERGRNPHSAAAG